MSQLVPFQFSKASCVAVGSFNIYIIQPAWLTRVGIFPPDTPIVIEANMARPGFRLSSPARPTVWFVAPGKLAIESEQRGADCGRDMAAVLNQLPETPVYGLGNNIFFRASRSEVESIPALDGCADLVVEPENYRKTKHAFATTLEHEGRSFSLQLTVGTEFVELTGNAHLQLKNDETARAAAETAERFEADTRTLTELLVATFRLKIEDQNVTTH